MGEVRVSLTALLLLIANPAWAQDEPGYAALLDKAKAAISANDYKAARALLSQAEAAAPASAALIQEKDLARLSFYRGAVEWRNGDKDTAALNHWRDAIVLSQSFQPEADILPDNDSVDVYYALIGEVKGRESVTLGLPEDPGDTMIFVDGRRMESFDAVLLGTHFVQLRCEDGNVVGSWYTFGAPPPDYLVLCSGGAYPVIKGGKALKAPKGPSKAALAKAEKEAAKQAALAAEAAATAEKKKAVAAKPAADKTKAADKTAADKTAADKTKAADKTAGDKTAADKTKTAEKVEKAAKPEKQPSAKKGSAVGWAMIAGGGAMMAGGGAINFLMVNPAWADAEAANADPHSVNRAEADAIVSRYNTGRYATIGLLAAGVATAGVGVFLGPLDSQIFFTPTGVGLAGRW